MPPPEIQESMTTMHRRILFAAALVLLAASARDVAAQGTGDTSRVYVNINAGFESTSGSLDDDVTFSLYDETGTKGVRGSFDSGAFIDLGFGAKVWRNLTVGVALHREVTRGDASATASVPHPLFFARNRSVALTVEDLDRKERAFHLQIGYLVPVTDRLDLHLFAGPTWYRLEQDVVSDLTFTEAAPFNSVNAQPVFATREGDAKGANIGVDVAYKILLEPVQLGAGMFIRYAGATAKVNILGNERETDVGGLQIGFGGRVRF